MEVTKIIYIELIQLIVIVNTMGGVTLFIESANTRMVTKATTARNPAG